MSFSDEGDADPPADTSRSRWLPALLETLAVASGAASLIYQVAWMRRLVLVFGSTTLATSTVLAAAGTRTARATTPQENLGTSRTFEETA